MGEESHGAGELTRTVPAAIVERPSVGSQLAELDDAIAAIRADALQDNTLASSEDIPPEKRERPQLDISNSKVVEKPELYREAYIKDKLKHSQNLDESPNEYVRDVKKRNLEKIKELRYLQSEEVKALTPDEADEILAAYMSDLEINGFIDTKTELFNETGIKDRLAAAISHSIRTKEPLSVGLMDLKGFKPVNDLISHDTGDRVLDMVGRHLKSGIRTEDTVGRLGGDEFFMIFQGSRAEAMNDRIKDMVEDSMAAYVQKAMLDEGIDPLNTHVTGRLGIVNYEPGDSVSRLMTKADVLVNQMRDAEKKAGTYSRDQIAGK